MATRRRRSLPSDGPAGAKRPVLRQIQEDEVEQLPATDVCTHWPPNPPFGPKRVQLRRMFSSMKARLSTTLSVTTRHVIINPWWKSQPFRGAGPSASFLPTNKWRLLRTLCLQYVTLCLSAANVSSSSARVATFVYTPQEARLGQAVCGHVIHKHDTTRHGLSGASFPHLTARVARLY